MFSLSLSQNKKKYSYWKRLPLPITNTSKLETKKKSITNQLWRSKKNLAKQWSNDFLALFRTSNPQDSRQMLTKEHQGCKQVHVPLRKDKGGKGTCSITTTKATWSIFWEDTIKLLPLSILATCHLPLRPQSKATSLAQGEAGSSCITTTAPAGSRGKRKKWGNSVFSLHGNIVPSSDSQLETSLCKQYHLGS